MKRPICNKHPENAIDNFLYSNSRDGYRCRKCRSEIMHNNYLNNKDKIRERTKKWRAANPGWRERYKKYKKEIKQIQLNNTQIQLMSNLRRIINSIGRIKRSYEQYKSNTRFCTGVDD